VRACVERENGREVKEDEDITPTAPRGQKGCLICLTRTPCTCHLDTEMDERTKYGHPPSAELPSLPEKIPFTCLFARLRRFATSTSSDCAYRVNNAQREHIYAERTIGNLRVRSHWRVVHSD